MHSKRQHALVIGGSIAGLMAARILSKHFTNVLLVERDQFPASVDENRRCVPQGRHTHGLLSSGAEIMESYFPGLLTELERGGAIACDPVAEGFWFQQGGPLAAPSSDLRGILASRPFLEGNIRTRLLALPNVRSRQNTVVEKLEMADGKVVGVHLEGGDVERADLVVDASGRGSHAKDWLNELGWQAPREEKMEISLAYSTRLFRRTKLNPDSGGKPILVIPPTPDGKRGGVALAQEGDRWTVTLISHFGSAPPLELEGFLEFARSLPSNEIHRTIHGAEPIGDGIPARMPATIRRRYEELTAFPEGFLVLGDAICSFNPIYGQGMSVACLEARALDDQLGRTSAEPLARRFFREAGKIVDTPWSIASGNDLRMPETKGIGSLGVRFVNWYVARLHLAAQSDAECSLAFHRVANLLDPPASLMKPSIALRVFKASRVRRGSLPGGVRTSPEVH
jgi:2-polyprenyl-6-methoxyphenol hydroxylase-like FAD-dependent oxidoreductase